MGRSSDARQVILPGLLFLQNDDGEAIVLTQAEWKRREEQYTEELNAILIPEDVDTVTIKQVISRLDRLRSRAFQDYVDAKTDWHAIQRKIEIVLKSTVDGSNDLERRASQYRRAREYPVGNATVNLFEIEDAYRRRYMFMTGLMEQIRSKADSLITDSNVLSTEAKLA